MPKTDAQDRKSFADHGEVVRLLEVLTAKRGYPIWADKDQAREAKALIERIRSAAA